MMPNSPNIIVIGSLNTDIVIQTPRRPRLGETVTGAEYMEGGGGKGANQALAAARLGGRAKMIGRIGRDAYGELVRRSLESGGVDISGVKSVEGVRTAVAFIQVERDGENSIVVASGANQSWQEGDIAEAESSIEQAPQETIVMLQLEIPLPVVTSALACARKRGLRIILDPAPVRSLPEGFFEGIDFATPNELEASQLARMEVRGVLTAKEAGKKLLQSGVRTAIITLGARGCVIVKESGSVHIPSYSVTPVDTTAAGDSFNGALAVAIGEGRSIEEAAAFANAAAALSTTKLGAQSSLPTRTEVDQFISRSAEMSSAKAVRRH